MRKNHIETIQPIFAAHGNFVSTFQAPSAVLPGFANVSIPSWAHQPESMSGRLQSLKPHILKNKQINKIQPQLHFAFSEIGKPLKMSWASRTTQTCQNNSSGSDALPCSHNSPRMLKTRRISTRINSSGRLLLQLSHEQSPLTTPEIWEWGWRRGVSLSPWGHHARTPPCSQGTSTRTSQAPHGAIPPRHPRLFQGWLTEKSSASSHC